MFVLIFTSSMVLGGCVNVCGVVCVVVCFLRLGVVCCVVVDVWGVMSNL